jgi:hypothetical protein
MTVAVTPRPQPRRDLHQHDAGRMSSSMQNATGAMLERGCCRRFPRPAGPGGRSTGDHAPGTARSTFAQIGDPSTLPSKSTEPADRLVGLLTRASADASYLPRDGLQWRNARTLSTYSGGAVPDSHRLPRITRPDAYTPVTPGRSSATKLLRLSRPKRATKRTSAASEG